MEADGVLALRPALTEYLREFDDCMGKRSNRAHLATYVAGQLGDGDRKSIEPIADRANVPPRTLQEFFGIFQWDHTRLIDRHQRRFVRRYGGRTAIGYIDETSFPKKGRETVGVQRQHCGALGKVENCVVSVHLGVATANYHTLLAGDLYMPEGAWIGHPDRRRKAGVPEDLAFRTKPQIAIDLWTRARANGARFSWLVFDEGYGNNPAFLHKLNTGGQRFVGEVPKSREVWTTEPRRRGRAHPCDRTSNTPGPAFRVQTNPPVRADYVLTYSPIARRIPWAKYSVMDATTGPMVWEVKCVPVWIKGEDDTPTPRPWVLMLARSMNQREEVKYFLSNAAEGVTTKEIAFAAFSRWRIERLFQDAKTDLGMDHFEVRKYTSVQRHLAISCVSHAFLAEVKHQALPKSAGPDHQPTPGRDRPAGPVVGAEPALFASDG